MLMMFVAASLVNYVVKYDAKDDEVNNDGTEHQSDISNGVN